MDYLQKIITAFELHSVKTIKECFENGISPNQLNNGKPLIYDLINMYSRGPLFKKCIKTFVNYGLEFDDKIFLAVLSDDSSSLNSMLAADIEDRYSKAIMAMHTKKQYHSL